MSDQNRNVRLGSLQLPGARFRGAHAPGVGRKQGGHGPHSPRDSAFAEATRPLQCQLPCFQIPPDSFLGEKTFLDNRTFILQ